MATATEVGKMMEGWEGDADTCPECGALATEKCSHERSGPAHSTQSEGFGRFDKFMDRILNEGARNRPRVPTASDSLQRLRASRVQERPLGRIRMGGSR